MQIPEWLKEFPSALMILDAQGIIVDMNDLYAQNVAAEGGRAMIGRSSLDCHPEPARSRLIELLQTHETNTYTIEKQGKIKLIYQGPLYEGGQFAGLFELSIILPEPMPHHIRIPKLK